MSINSIEFDKEIVRMNNQRNSIESSVPLREDRQTRIIKQLFTDVSELDKIRIEETIISKFEEEDFSNSNLIIKWHNDDNMVVEIEIKILPKENIDAGTTITIGEIIFL